MRRYPYRRGAAVLVFASCNKERGRWVAEKGHQSNLPRVRAMAALLHLDIVAELASAATSGPTAAEISAHFAELASRDFSEYDALVVATGARTRELRGLAGLPLTPCRGQNLVLSNSARLAVPLAAHQPELLGKRLELLGRAVANEGMTLLD